MTEISSFNSCYRPLFIQGVPLSCHSAYTFPIVNADIGELTSHSSFHLVLPDDIWMPKKEYVSGMTKRRYEVLKCLSAGQTGSAKEGDWEECEDHGRH